MPVVSDEEAIRVLNGLNPWWSDRHSSIPAFRRLAYYECRKLLDNRKLKRAVFLSGPRRVGKSVILRQIAQGHITGGSAPTSVLYLSLDIPQLKLFTIEQLLRLYHTVHPSGKPALLLIDEVHYAQDWDLQLKALVDHHPEYRILATGSASVRQRADRPESGVGRWVTVPIPTLSFFEFLAIRGTAKVPEPDPAGLVGLFRLTRGKLIQYAEQFRPLLPEFNRYLLVGGFPETAQIDDTEQCQRLLREDVVERVLKRDMTALFGVRLVAELERLFIYLCYHTGAALNVSTAAVELGLTRPTVTHFLDLLEQANLVYRLPAESQGGKKALKARHKYYLADAALRNAVLLRSDDALRTPEELGLIVETTVLRHIAAYYYDQTPRLGYWRSGSSDLEVDIIARMPSGPIPFEVKYRSSANLSSAPGLVEFCSTERPERAYLITRHDAEIRLSSAGLHNTPVLEIPAHVLCFLLGRTERTHLANEKH